MTNNRLFRHKPFVFLQLQDTILLPTFKDVVLYDERAGVCTPASVDLPVQDAFRNATCLTRSFKSSV